MAIEQILVLALVQGITEFLPVSSSGHLALIGAFAEWPDQGLEIDIAVHFGSLLAVMVYFHRDVWAMIRGAWMLLLGRRDAGARLVIHIFIASIPVIIAGYLLRDVVGHLFRNPALIAWTTIGFGLVLWLADAVGMTLRRMEHIGPGMALMIGCAQVLALVPGVSRSGITMTAARFLGMERADAARFSLLLSIPALAGAATLTGVGILENGDWTLGRDALLAVALSFVAALLSIALMMSWLRRANFRVFAIYRLLLGAALLVWIYY